MLGSGQPFQRAIRLLIARRAALNDPVHIYSGGVDHAGLEHPWLYDLLNFYHCCVAGGRGGRVEVLCCMSVGDVSV